MEIKLAGKAIRLKFGMHVAEHLGEVIDGDSGMVDKSAALISLAHENYVKATPGEVVQITRQEIYQTIEDDTLAGEQLVEVAKVWNAFGDCSLVKSLLEKAKAASEIIEATEQPKKKKLAGRK